MSDLRTMLSEEKTRQSVLILTDDAEPVNALGKEIAAALKAHEVKFKTAPAFEGTDLLPADVFFIGCEKPSPASFTYIEKMLKHINLAGRFCGIFSTGDAGAIDYLSTLLRDSEASVKSLQDVSNVSVWTQTVVKSTTPP